MFEEMSKSRGIVRIVTASRIYSKPDVRHRASSVCRHYAQTVI